MQGTVSKFVQLDGKQISFLKKYFGDDAERTDRVFDFYHSAFDDIPGYDII